MLFPSIFLSKASLSARCRFSTISVLLAAGVQLPLHAAEAPLTLPAAQRLAVGHSRQLAAQDYAAAASRDMAVAAGQLPDPVLKAGIDNLPVSGADRFSLTNDFMTMRRIGVMQEMTRSDKRRLRAERYEREADKSIAAKAAAAAAIQRDTALAWLERYYTEKMADVLTAQIAQARLEIEAADAAYRGGRGSQADLLAARSGLLGLADRDSELQRRLNDAKTMLSRWTGIDSDQALANLPSIDSISWEENLLERQLAHHPQIDVYARQQEIAATEVKLAQANKQADWSVEVAYQQRGPAYSNMVSVGFSIPFQLDQKNRQDRELSSKLALLEQARADADEALRQHVAETRTMINDWRNTRERQRRYQQELLPLAEERSAALLAAYRGGKTALGEVLAARRNEMEVQLQNLQLQLEAARLWAQLTYLTPDTATIPGVGSMGQEIK